MLILDAIDGLLDTVRPVLLTDETGDPIQLFDGPEAEWPDRRFVAIGLTPDDVEQSGTQRPGGLQAEAEEADITCLIRMWSGDTDYRPLRVDAAAQLDAIDTAIAEGRRRLGGAVDNAEVTSKLYIPSTGRRGRCVDVIFTVHVRKF